MWIIFSISKEINDVILREGIKDIKLIIFFSICYFREYLAKHYEATGELLVDLGSDQTSLHNPFNGGYYPAQVRKFGQFTIWLPFVKLFSYSIVS